MSERKKKSRVTDENVTHTSEYSSRTSSDNFNEYFLALCEEYDVTPLPKLLPLGNSPAEVHTMNFKNRSQKIQKYMKFHFIVNIQNIKSEMEISAPLIHVTYEKAKELSNIEKIDCKGYEISVCILDALSMSMEKFRTVTTIRLRNCRINAFGITQIAQIITEIGCVRDLNLDMNPNIRENYYLLCSTSGNLRFLSLKYCNISDVGIEKIANELKYKENKMSQLIGLNIANNRITDFGAEHIATMLHTNRSLQSLILTGNRITDVGAAPMIQELCMYSLTHEEIIDLRRSNYNRLLNNSVVKSQNSITSDSRISTSSSRISSSKKNLKMSKTRKAKNSRKSANDKGEILSMKKSSIDSTILHPFVDEIRHIKGQIMAVGNFSLQHLNLSYNHLTDETTKKIVKCLFYQSYALLGDPSKGLLHISLEGNDFQIEENENVKQLRELLRDRLSSRNEEEIMEKDYTSVA